MNSAELTDADFDAKPQVGPAVRRRRQKSNEAVRHHGRRCFAPPFLPCLPQVLLLGQYSVGKTSFISYLMVRKKKKQACASAVAARRLFPHAALIPPLTLAQEREFPGAHIGPEPTTDRFIAIMHGPTERVTPGEGSSWWSGRLHLKALHPVLC